MERSEEQQTTQNAHTPNTTQNTQQGRLFLRELRDMLRPEQAPLLLLIVVIALLTVRVMCDVCCARGGWCAAGVVSSTHKKRRHARMHSPAHGGGSALSSARSR